MPKKRPRDWHKRRFCSVACANRAPRRPTWHSGPRSDTDGRLEEVQMLIGAGESYARIPGRLGVKPQSLSRWLRNNGHLDLARRFERVDVVKAA